MESVLARYRSGERIRRIQGKEESRVLESKGMNLELPGSFGAAY
jgi:hypothetical protein